MNMRYGTEYRAILRANNLPTADAIRERLLRGTRRKSCSASMRRGWRSGDCATRGFVLTFLRKKKAFEAQLSADDANQSVPSLEKRYQESAKEQGQ